MRGAGRAYVTERLVSTSRDPRVATENFTTDAVYAVLSSTGRSIEPFSAARHEREVVLLPGTVLTLVEELDPAAEGEPEVDLAAWQVEIGRAVLEAELREPVPDPIAGKFAGDVA